ncbi:E3 ubiquitin-protein ligase RNF168-like [Molossus nigricans]
MAIPEEAIPPLSKYQCGICLEILIEPVTLPCDHTLCKPCFQSIVEKSNLCCPFCRFWISGWTRYHTRRNSLVNMELWEKIQKHYPEECKRRISCQESEEIFNDFQPVRLLSEPGELRKEYEEEISKMEALLQANKEEENKVSEEYIQKLLVEEEEEEKRQARKRRRQRKKQLKSDEELARKLSFNINYFCEESDLTFPMFSRESDGVITRLQKKRMNQQTHTEDIQEYLSPKSQSAPVSLSEIVQDGKKNYMSKETDSCIIKSPMWQDTEIEEVMPTLSPQIRHEIQEQGAEFSIESPMPQLCASGTESFLGDKVRMTPNKHVQEVCVMIHEEPKAGIPYPREATVKLCGKAERGCVISNMTQIIGNNTVETENETSYLLSSKKDISKTKKQETLFEKVEDPCFSAKRGKTFPKASSDQEETGVIVTQKPLHLEHLLFERQNQEEQDRLSALNPHKEVDKE